MSTSNRVVLASPKDEKQTIHALIIGINEYKSPRIRDLRYCINDAKKMKQYLENNPWNMSTNITTLYNEQATRESIVEALRKLQNITIHRSDPILIFYAGHGGRARVPRKWNTENGSTQMIVPYDCLYQLKRETIHGIPGRTINALLRKLADAKRDNITVILDCCFSGSGTRTNESEPPNENVRGIEIEIEIPEDLDDEDCTDGANRDLFTPHELANGGLASHVVFAACRSDEKAYEGYYENYGGGEFSRALGKALASLGSYSERFSNLDLIRKIGTLQWQHPQCDGKNIGRLFLSTAYPMRQPDTYSVRKEGRTYFMDAGTVEGISSGATFRVYEMPAKVEIGTLIASKPEEFSTTMRLPKGLSPFNIKEKAVAVQISQGEEETLRVHIGFTEFFQLRPLFYQALKELEKCNERQRTISLVKIGGVDLEIQRKDNNIVFKTLYEPATRHGIRDLNIVLPFQAEKLAPILDRAAHYYWHLRRAMKVHNPTTDQIAFTEVQEKADTFTKDGNKVFLPSGLNLVHDDVVDVVVAAKGAKRRFGITFRNIEQRDLYVWIFCFNHRSMVIELLRRPPERAADSAIPQSKGGYLPFARTDRINIGHTDSTRAPLTFTCRDLKTDLSFIVFFVSTKPVNLSSVLQKPEERDLDPPDDELLDGENHWYTHVIPIVQRPHVQSRNLPTSDSLSHSIIFVILGLLVLLIALVSHVYFRSRS